MNVSVWNLLHFALGSILHGATDRVFSGFMQITFNQNMLMQ